MVQEAPARASPRIKCGGLYCKMCGGCIRRDTFRKHFKETEYTICHTCEPSLMIDFPTLGACKAFRFQIRHQDIPELIRILEDSAARMECPPYTKRYEIVWNRVKWRHGWAPRNKILINRWFLVTDGFRVVSVAKYTDNRGSRGFRWEFFPSFGGLGATFCHPDSLIDHHIFMHSTEVKYYAEIWDGLPNNTSNDEEDTD